MWGPTRKWVRGAVGEVEIARGGEVEERERERRERGFGPVENSRPCAEACGARTVRGSTAGIEGCDGMDGRDIMGSTRRGGW